MGMIIMPNPQAARVPSPRPGHDREDTVETWGAHTSGSHIMKGLRVELQPFLNSQSPILSTKHGENHRGASHLPRSRCILEWRAAGSQSASPRCISQSAVLTPGFKGEEGAPCLLGALEFHSKSFLGG